MPKVRTKDPRVVAKIAKANPRARMAMDRPTTPRKARARKETVAKVKDLGAMTTRAKGSSLRPRAHSFTVTSGATDAMAKVI